MYFASKDTVKKLTVSWLVAMTMTDESVAAKAKNLNRRWHTLTALAMDFAFRGKWLDLINGI